MNENDDLIRHFLVTMAYRLQLVVGETPQEFSDFDAGNGVLRPSEIIHHMTHIGQLAMLSRLYGLPIPGRDFSAAKIETGRFRID